MYLYPRLGCRYRATVYEACISTIWWQPVTIDGVEPNLLAVTYCGQPIPIRVMSPAGAFVNGVDGPAYLEYVGQAANTQYTGTSVYVLELNAAKAVRIGLNQSRLSKKPTFESSYMATTTVDRNNRYSLGLADRRSLVRGPNGQLGQALLLVRDSGNGRCRRQIHIQT